MTRNTSPGRSRASRSVFHGLSVWRRRTAQFLTSAGRPGRGDTACPHRNLIIVMKRMCCDFVWTATMIVACTLSPLFAQSAVTNRDADVFAALLRNTASVGGSAIVVVD